MNISFKELNIENNYNIFAWAIKKPLRAYL